MKNTKLEPNKLTKKKKKSKLENRLTKRDFMKIVSDKSDIEIDTLLKSWDAISQCLVNELLKGNSVLLTNFGTFYLKKHKGHNVQGIKRLQGGEVATEKMFIDDYNVFSFSPSEQLSSIIRGGNKSEEKKRRLESRKNQ